MMKSFAISLSLAFAFVFAAPLAQSGSTARAQTGQPAPTITQVRLTEQHVQGFIAMQKVLTELARTLEGDADANDDTVVKKLEALAKQNGFDSFAQFDNIAANITLVISGIDPDTGKYTDPRELMRADIADIRTDTTLNDKERAELIADLEAAIKGTPVVEHPENIEVVRRFAREIEGVIN